MSSDGNVPKNCNANSGFLGALNCGSGIANDRQGETTGTLAAALVTASASFGVQLLLFTILRLRLSRIYRPRSYLVPERERVPPPPRGVVAWLKPLFTTPNLAFIQKCGLDAYFFLRYLRMLLKIFVPMAVVILPILLPLNYYSGSNLGLDQFSISNVANKHKADRLWAHLVLALCVIAWVLYVIYRELRGYIRVRQAYLTSPQHRIRASATTVLVTGIPRKWLTHEALNGLYDVFPGGIRNIWINRNYDDLADKVTYRNSLAKNLEDAETNLVKMCRKKHDRDEERRRKEQGKKKKTKGERHHEQEEADAAAQTMAQGTGLSAGDQHDHPQGLQEALHEAEEAEERRDEHEKDQGQLRKRFGVLGDGFNVLGQGLDNMGKGMGRLGRGLADDMGEGFQKATNGVDQRIEGQAFARDSELYRFSGLDQDGVPPTPPPKTPYEEREARLQSMQTDGPADSRRGRSQLEQHSPTAAYDYSNNEDVTPSSENTGKLHSIRMTGPSAESTRPSPFQTDDPMKRQRSSTPKWKVWRNSGHSIALPSPKPHFAEDHDSFPLTTVTSRANHSRDGAEMPNPNGNSSSWMEKLAFWKSKNGQEVHESYPDAFNQGVDEDQDGDAYWRRYLEPKEREMMRVPILSPTWCPSLPLIGKKVDRIYWTRRELAKMNLEIEMDQKDPEKFAYMNSAFIQFNHQVAAHMACQSVSHHVPQHMAPRLVEISPDDVIWTNMSITWWERYLRSTIVLIIAAGLIILYAIPVTAASLLSKLSTLIALKPFAWLATLPPWLLSAIQGVLGPLLLAIILALIPVIFGILVKQQGVPTGTGRELGVQQWYFTFLFIQVFLVVSITGGLVSLITNIASNPAEIISELASDLPKASNYFFYYLTVQALSNSASALLQVGALVGWFLLGPLMDGTARSKWRRQTTLPNVTWGSFFPPFTNFAVIGLVYSVIAPMMLVFMVVIFWLFWIVYRYNVFYVYQFRHDTGGLLFPTAVNQLFVGLYTMELCLIGFFFIARTPDQSLACLPQAIIMVFALLITVVYQWLLNSAFRPLFQYLPITLEDEAVIRDEQFAKAQESKFQPLNQQEQPEDERDIQDVLAEREQRESHYENQAIEREQRDIEERRRSRGSHLQLRAGTTSSSNDLSPRQGQNNHSGLASPSWHTDRWRQSTMASRSPTEDLAKLRNLRVNRRTQPTAEGQDTNTQPTEKTPSKDVEAQHTVGDVLFSGFADELEDLTPEERDVLVRYAFQHAALRAKRPVVWIPRDKLGVSDDEIRRAKKMSTIRVDDTEKGGQMEKTNIWMSNEGTALDGKGKVVFRRSPPDFSNVDLIAL